MPAKNPLKCVKGKPCGNSCIQKTYKCRKQLSQDGDTSSALTTISETLKRWMML